VTTENTNFAISPSKWQQCVTAGNFFTQHTVTLVTNFGENPILKVEMANSGQKKEPEGSKKFPGG
jgi:hypothetical protein